MFRHIRSKLIAAFAVPLAILVAVAGLEALSSIGQINSVDEQTYLASASVGPGGVVQALQTERIYAILSIFTATHVTSLAPPLAGLTPASDGLYQNMARLEATTQVAVGSFETSVQSAGPQAIAAYGDAFQALESLATARSYWAAAGKAAAANTRVITNYQSLATKTYNSYTAMINALITDTAQVPLKINDPTLRTGVEALDTSLAQTESQWQVVQDLFVASWSSGTAQKSEINLATQDWGADQSWGQRLAALSKGPYAKAISDLDQSPVNDAIDLDIGFMQAGQLPPLSGVVQSFTSPAQGTATTGGLTPSALGVTEIGAVIAKRGNELHTSAVEQAITFGAVGLIGTLLGLVLVIMVSRSVSRPLVDLARQADELATTTLPSTVHAILEASNSGHELPPAPKVKVNSRDEVADMARALDAVNKTAVELATGQAALRRNLADAFVNLGRRNQNLVTRQLEYISEIELKEADPESLEELFRLDHLATRMRRNAESLLILAGSGPARQWSQAVPAMDVARAASAEVEDYKRLRLHHFDPAQIAGAVTTDLVHILAELIENALTFSPPGSPVDVYGRFLEGGYVIVIVDSGIGMSVDDLETANRRLEGEGSDAEVPGRYLGHFVAGRLASRHDITISLQSSHSGGLVARVKIPAQLIEEPVPDLSAIAEVRSAPAGASLDRPGRPASPGSLVPRSLSPAQEPLAGSPPAPFAPVAPVFDRNGNAPPLNGIHGGEVLEHPSATGPTFGAPIEASHPGTNGSGTNGSGTNDHATPASGTPASTYGAGLGDNGHSSEDAVDADKVLAQWADEMAERSWGGAPEPDSLLGDVDPALNADQIVHYDDQGPFSGLAAPAEAAQPADGTADVADAEPTPVWDLLSTYSHRAEPAPEPGADAATPADTADDGTAAPLPVPDEGTWHLPAPDQGTWHLPAREEGTWHLPAPDQRTYDYGDAAPLSAAQPEAPVSFGEVAPAPVESSQALPQPAAPPATPNLPTANLPTPDLGTPGVGTPDLGILSPLAATNASGGLPSPAPKLYDQAADAQRPYEPPPPPPPAAPSPGATTKASAWDTLPAGGAAPVGPAAQARNTADGLRKLTRRVPGASLPQEDNSLRRATPTSTTRNPLGLSGALSQYLSATASEGRPEKEHNAR